MSVVGISYTEGNKKDLQYKSVSISYKMSSKEKIFDSGNFIKDWYDCIKFMIVNKIMYSEPFCHSSSVNHFIRMVRHIVLPIFMQKMMALHY